MSNNYSAVAKSMEKRRVDKAIEHLLGMVTGMVADAHLHEREVQLLQTWLAEHPEAKDAFPGNVIARKVQEVLADGVITEPERAHLLAVLTEMAATDFSSTGSASPEVLALPIEDCVTIELKNSMVCLTGEFLYGTRAACERLVLAAGGMCSDSVSKKVDVLIIGTRVSADWAHTTFGRKIQRATELQEQGHAIEIISERKMMDVLSTLK
jgi:NAD-dependent DNA ligase